MKTLLTFLIALLAVTTSATNVRFNMVDITGRTNDLPLTVQGLVMPFGSSNYVVAGYPIRLQPVGGTITTNLVPATYRLTVVGPSPAQTIDFAVTNSTETLDVRDLASFKLSAFSASQYLTIDQSDARYASITNTGSGTGGDASGAETNIRLAIPGPHGDLRGLTHPNLVRVSGGFGGYEYWLTFSGTTNQTAEPFGVLTEDIFVRGSADLIDWSAGQESQLMSRDDFQTVATNGWLADPELYYDADAGLLRCLWAGFLAAGANGYQQWLYTANSEDGATWSTPELIRTWFASNDIPGSASLSAPAAGPQIVTLADGSLRLYAVDEGNYAGGTNALWFVPGLDTSGTNWDWSSRTICALDPFSADTSLPWHFDLTLVDGTYHMLYGSQSTDLWGEYTMSADGITWDTPWAGALVDQKLWQSTYRLYKVAWLPVAGPDGLSWNMILGKAGPTTNPSADQWQLGAVRGWTPNFQEMSRPAQNTNWWIEGSEKLLQLAGVVRPAMRTFYEMLSPTAGGMVSIGAAEANSGAVVFGTGSATNISTFRAGGTPMIRNSGTDYLLIHTRTNGGIQFRHAQNIRGGLGLAGGWYIGETADTTTPTGSLSVQSNLTVAGTISGDGSGLSNLFSRTYADADSIWITNRASGGLRFADGDDGAMQVEQIDRTGFIGRYRGDGVNLTNLNADNLFSGTVNANRLPQIPINLLPGVTNVAGLLAYSATSNSAIGLGGSVPSNVANGTWFGHTANYQNTGANASGFGSLANYQNTGANASGFGSLANHLNTGANASGFGYFANRQNDAVNATALGAQSFNSFVDATPISIYSTNISATGNYITNTHGFGTPGLIFMRFDGPSNCGLTSNTLYRFYVTNSALIVCERTITNSGTGSSYTLTPRRRFHNSTALGYDAEPSASNQIALGSSLVNRIKVGTAGSTATVENTLLVSGSVTATNGYFLPTNSLANWPAEPSSPGAAYFGNSNGVVFILTSGLGTSWTSTNKLAP